MLKLIALLVSRSSSVSVRPLCLGAQAIVVIEWKRHPPLVSFQKHCALYAAFINPEDLDKLWMEAPQSKAKPAKLAAKQQEQMLQQQQQQQQFLIPSCLARPVHCSSHIA